MIEVRFPDLGTVGGGYVVIVGSWLVYMFIREKIYNKKFSRY